MKSNFFNKFVKNTNERFRFGEIDIIAENNKLEEETAFKFFDEIGYVILGLKNRVDFFSKKKLQESKSVVYLQPQLSEGLVVQLSFKVHVTAPSQQQTGHHLKPLLCVGCRSTTHWV